jgi:phosphoribosylpyrophosphate synthetase
MTFKIEVINNGYLVHIFMTDNTYNDTVAQTVQYALDEIAVSNIIQSALFNGNEKPKNRVI